MCTLNEWWSQIKGVILIEKDFLKLKKQIIFILFKLSESEISQIGKIPNNFQPILWFHFKNSFASGYFCIKKTIKEFYSWNLITNFSFHEHNWFSATFIGLIKRQIHANSRVARSSGSNSIFSSFMEKKDGDER